MKFDCWERWLCSSPRRPLVMGILNLTADSFSRDGILNPSDAIGRAIGLERAGADLIDIGAESTKPGSEPVPAQMQIDRIQPVLQELRRRSDIALSIDTTRHEVITAFGSSKISLVNDVSAGRFDSYMFSTAAKLGLSIVLMHMLRTPRTMQINPTYGDVLDEVSSFLLQRRHAAIEAGIEASRILFDPGIGFGKTIEHNLVLLRNLNALANLGPPLLVGTSRKAFIGKLLDQPDASRRLMGTAATVAWCVANHASIVRVHDVEEMAAVVRVIRSIQCGTPD